MARFCILPNNCCILTPPIRACSVRQPHSKAIVSWKSGLRPRAGSFSHEFWDNTHKIWPKYRQISISDGSLCFVLCLYFQSMKLPPWIFLVCHYKTAITQSLTPILWWCVLCAWTTEKFELLPDMEIWCNFSVCVLLAGGRVAFEYFSNPKHTFSLLCPNKLWHQHVIINSNCKNIYNPRCCMYFGWKLKCYG